MQDMLVNLYALDKCSGALWLEKKISKQSESKYLLDDVVIRKLNVYETHLLVEWVGLHFSAKWQSEVRVAMSRQPATVWVATYQKQIMGFACYDTTAKGFFGPTGVAEDYRGLGLGEVLLYKSLESLKELGYVYAFIGGVGPREFYEKSCGAKVIGDSEQGLYQDILPENKVD